MEAQHEDSHNHSDRCIDRAISSPTNRYSINLTSTERSSQDALDLLKALSFEQCEITPSDSSTAGALHRDLAAEYQAKTLEKDPSRVDKVAGRLSVVLESDKTIAAVKSVSLETLREHKEFRSKLGKAFIKLGRDKKLGGLMSLLEKTVSPKVEALLNEAFKNPAFVIKPPAKNLGFENRRATTRSKIRAV